MIVAWPRPITPWQTEHDGDCGGGWPSGSVRKVKGFAVGGDCPNGPVLDCTGVAKENGGAGDRPGAVVTVSLYFVEHTGQAAVPETQRRWNLWAHSDVNKACRRPMPPRQASHGLLVLFDMILPNFRFWF